MIYGNDLNTMSLIFESMYIRDLRVFAEALEVRWPG